jgi:copper chaperone
MKIQVENLKCGGCKNSIEKALLEIVGVKKVEVSLEKNEVTVEGEFNEQVVCEKLDHMGYSVVGHNSLLKKAKSYVSCAIGRMDE